MTPPTIPSPNSPAGDEITDIIINALRDKGFDCGVTDRSHVGQWYDFDIIPTWGSISIGSKRRNRSYLQVTWEKRTITFAIYGHRWEGQSYESFTINLADPDSLSKIVDYILKVALEDKYKYPFI